MNYFTHKDTQIKTYTSTYTFNLKTVHVVVPKPVTFIRNKVLFVIVMSIPKARL